MKFLILFAVLYSSAFSYANMLDAFPIEMTCKETGSEESFVEIYTGFNTENYIFAFKDKGEVVSLSGVRKLQNDFILKNHLFNATLIQEAEGMFEFSVYEAELQGNGKVIVAPSRVECKEVD